MISLQTKGIFTELLESDSKKSAFEMFLKSEYINVNVLKGNSEIAINRNKIFNDYSGYKDEYNQIFNEFEYYQLVWIISFSIIKP